MLQRSGVVAENRALADAEPPAAAFEVDDVALGEPRRPVWTPRFAFASRSASMTPSARASSSRRVIDGRIAAATTAVGSTL